MKLMMDSCQYSANSRPPFLRLDEPRTHLQLLVVKALNHARAHHHQVRALHGSSGTVVPLPLSSHLESPSQQYFSDLFDHLPVRQWFGLFCLR